MAQGGGPEGAKANEAIAAVRNALAIRAGVMDVNSADPITLDGGCHCGAVRFTVDLPFGLASARRCNCSIAPCAARWP